MDAQKTVLEVFAAIEAGNMTKAGSYMTDDFTFSGPVPQPVSKDEFLGLQGELVKAIPDWKFNAQNLKTQGDAVTGNVKITGTHSATLAPLMPGMPAVPATGKKVALPDEPFTLTFRGDKVASFDVAPISGGGVMGILSQIGVQMPH